MLLTTATVRAAVAGSLVAWGQNNANQTNCPAGNDYVAIAAGSYHGVALRRDGSLVAWGDINWGKLNCPTGNNYVAVSAGQDHNVALRNDGTLVAWGANGYGQTNCPPGSNYVAVSCGYWQSLALRNDGSLVAWGWNRDGVTNCPTKHDFVAISASDHNIALRSNDTLVSWGYNSNGQTNCPAGNDYTMIAAGGDFSVAMRTNGTLVAWGNSADGRTNCPTGNTYAAIDAGGTHTIALRNDGSLVAWGNNSYGQTNCPAGNGYMAAAAGTYYCLALREETTPFVDITNPPPALLNYHVDSYGLGGTNNMYVQGDLWWTNASGTSFGSFSRTGDTWACIVTGLLEGDNLIRVCGTNLWGKSATDTVLLRRGYERDLPRLDPIPPSTLRERQVLLRQVTGRTNVAAVTCDAGAVAGASFFGSNTWRFSCIPGFGTASQVWNIAFIGMNQYGAETQTLVVSVAPHVKKITPKKPLLFEDEDGDLLSISYSGIKKAGSVALFDGQNLVVNNAMQDGTLSFAVKQNRKTGGNGSFILRDVRMDNDGKCASIGGDVDQLSMAGQRIESVKFGAKAGVVSNIALESAKTISTKGTIVGTIAVSKGFETLTAGALNGARILAGVPASADVTNTPATATFKTLKATTMDNSIVAGRDTMMNDKVVTPGIKVKAASNSTFFRTGTNGIVTPVPIAP